MNVGENSHISDHIEKGATSFNLSTYFLNTNAGVTGIFSSYLESVSLSSGITSGNLSNNAPLIGRTDDGSNSCKTIFRISNNLDSYRLYFSLKYSFKFPTGNDFQSQVYSKLGNGNSFSFSFRAEVE